METDTSVQILFVCETEVSPLEERRGNGQKSVPSVSCVCTPACTYWFLCTNKTLRQASPPSDGAVLLIGGAALRRVATCNNMSLIRLTNAGKRISSSSFR